MQKETIEKRYRQQFCQTSQYNDRNYLYKTIEGEYPTLRLFRQTLCYLRTRQSANIYVKFALMNYNLSSLRDISHAIYQITARVHPIYT